MTTRAWLGRALICLLVWGCGWVVLDAVVLDNAAHDVAWGQAPPGAESPALETQSLETDAPAPDAPEAKVTAPDAPATDAPSADAVPTPGAGQKAASSQTAATAEEFDQAFRQWRQLLVRMRELQVRHLSAADFQRPALSEEYEGLIRQSEEMIGQLQALAESSYQADPEARSQAGGFLFMVAVAAFRGDDLEKADHILQMLIDEPSYPATIYDLAGMVAFGVGDMDRAEKYLTKAQETRVISSKAAEMLPQIDAYREFWARERALREAEAGADDLPRVLLRTNKGDIVVELFENDAPNTVANFIDLVEKRFYNGLTFHRVLEDFMAQGGCPLGTGSGGPGYTIEDEHTRDDFRRHFRGSLSMAKTAAPHTGGSQFFIMFTPNQRLDGMHTVFGRVIEGMDVVSHIQRRDPDKDPVLAEPDKIIEARVLRKRDHEYAPKKYRQGD
jgi:cyclophilin family peptidyl-prolyl cis-trans isomerase